jgi:stress-induced morphogen
MATIVRGNTDEYQQRIKAALDEYENLNPGSVAELYRQNLGSIRIRIVDSKFRGMSKVDRHDLVLNFLAARLDNDTMEEISVLLALAPDELRSSFMNAEFDDPVRSTL